MSLKVFLLGQFNLLSNDQSLDLPSRPAQSLLAYLVLHPGVEHRREKLAALFWPETQDSNARSYLRQALWRVKKSFADGSLSWQDYLQINDISVRFKDKSDYWLDTDQLTAPSKSESVENMIEVINLYQGELLPGFYDEWIVLERDHISAAYIQKMNILLDCLVENRQWDDVLSWSENWILLGYSPEPAYRALMLAHARRGDQSLILTTYKRCEEALDRDLGVSPSPETHQLFIQLQDGESIAAPLIHSTSSIQTDLPLFLIEGGQEIRKNLFVARENELFQLEQLLDQAKSGCGRVAFITGEAGSGKTSLIQEFTYQILQAKSDVIVANGNCNAHSGIGDPYLPFREILELLTGDVESRWSAGAITDEHARLLWNTSPLTVQALLEVGPDLIDTFISGSALVNRASKGKINDFPYILDLIQIVNRKATSPSNPNPLQQNLFHQYTKVLQFLSQKITLVLVVDDLQWADLGSLSLLFHLGRQLKGCNILIIGSYRPEEVALEVAGDRHPLIPVVNEIQRQFGDTSINLDKTDSFDFIESVIDSEPNMLQTSFREMLYKQTRGHPLFTIELLRGLQERSELIQDSNGYWIESQKLSWDTMPGRVEAVIAERISRLSEPMRLTLCIASVEGETFTAEIIAQVQGIDDREVLTCLSGELERKHRLVKAQSIQRLNGQLLSSYRFQHILFQKYLYNSLDEIERVHLHERVGTALEKLYIDREQKLIIAPSLARHFHEARITDKEIDYLHQAGERALQMSAYEEAITHLTRSLDLLMTQPDSPERAERELALQLSLGRAWIGPQGYGPNLKSAYTRARHLCENLEKNHRLCQVLGQLCVVHFVKAEYQEARELAEEALQLAEQINDPLLISLGHWYLGFIWFSLGNQKTARSHIKHVINFYDAGQHHHFLVDMRGSDAGISALSYDALSLWCLGYKDQAFKQSQEAIDLARELNHPFTLVDALCYAGCWLNAMEHDADNLLIYASQLKEISFDNKFAGWSGSGTYFFGEALARTGQIEAGIAQIKAGIESELSIYVRCSLIGALRALAEAQLETGRSEDGLGTIQEALDLVRKSGERLWEAEIYRIQGQLMLLQGKEPEAEESFQKSIQISQQQKARSWELRSTTDLARLWCLQGKQDKARNAIVEIIEWFTEGFDSSDLVNAKKFLEELT